MVNRLRMVDPLHHFDFPVQLLFGNATVVFIYCGIVNLPN
jgi:hypothetical protein